MMKKMEKMEKMMVNADGCGLVEGEERSEGREGLGLGLGLGLKA